jgi:hypothetical protein
MLSSQKIPRSSENWKKMALFRALWTGSEKPAFLSGAQVKEYHLRSK